jgi:hypothetical protein
MSNSGQVLADGERGDSDGGIGQEFDAAMRRWAEPNLAVVAGWLDSSVVGLGAGAFTRQAASFAVPTIHADLLIMAGPSRLMHVEYETHPRKSLVSRMYNYRGRIMDLHPGTRLSQHIVVLGDGRVTGYDDLNNGFVLDLHVVYLREHDPGGFLADPVLAPLAVLTRGSRKERQNTLAAAFTLISQSRHPQTQDLLQIAETLATIRLPHPSIIQIREETKMSIQPIVQLYKTTPLGDEMRDWGREETLLAMLSHRFGERPEIAEAAKRLASWPQAAAVEAILSTADPALLLTAEPPG